MSDDHDDPQQLLRYAHHRADPDVVGDAIEAWSICPRRGSHPAMVMPSGVGATSTAALKLS